MPGKVFISCGQRPDEEKHAFEVKKWFDGRDFNAYVAKRTQDIQDVNSAIIDELMLSDYFVFIDFKREPINFFRTKFRGSLFSHQEVALAYYSNFDKVIFLSEKGVLLEGFLEYILGNPITFNHRNEIVSKIEEEVERSGWMSEYSRHLVLGDISSDLQAWDYGDQTGGMSQFIWQGKIKNLRKDIAARDVLAILRRITDTSTVKTQLSPDQAFLKWAGIAAIAKGYSRTIFPESEGVLDLFALSFVNPLEVYIHSCQDRRRRPIFTGKVGNVYRLDYEVFAQGFPMLNFSLLVELTGIANTTVVKPIF